MKKFLSVCCCVVLLLMSVALPGCSNSSSSNSSSSDSSGSDSSDSGSIGSDSPPNISAASLPVCVIGQAYSQQISVTGGSGMITFSIVQGSLPSGITLSSAGSIAGTTMVAPGVFPFTVRVQDAEGSDTQDFSLIVVAETVAVATPQPYETIRNNPSYYYVSQESGLCGATSFYMTMKYYGDHLKKIKTGIADKDCPAEITEKIYYPTELSATSQIATYIQYIDNTLNSLAGIHLSSLVKAAEGLLDESGVRALYGEVIVDNYRDDLTGTENDISVQKKNIFLNRIVPFLNSGSPVLLHLWRSPVLGIPSSGHYVLVIGYNASENVVYFMDPNDLNHQGSQCDCVATDSSNPDICFIQKVNFGFFIEDFWYKSDDPYVLNARWDGNWVGFRH